MILHAGLVARLRAGAWQGVLIEGASGAGKSDLALRALEFGFRLVADDRTLVFVSGGRMFGRAPESLRGLIEVRGLGVLGAGHLPLAQIVMAVSCQMDSAAIERSPAPAFRTVLGIRLPLAMIAAHEASAAAKLCRALEALGPRPQQG